ncbi:MAG: HAMP domain-containing sensor histidine kinase [Sphingomonas taxi]
MRRWLRWSYGSMMGQTTLLTVALLTIGLYWLAVRPIQQIMPVASTTLDATAAQVTGGINAFLARAEQAPDTPMPSDLARLLDSVGRINPDFGYYIAVRDRHWSNLPAPRYFRRFGLDRMVDAKARIDAPGLCAQMFRDLSGPSGKGSMEYIQCDSLRYYEVSGIAHPLPHATAPGWRDYLTLTWRLAVNFVHVVLIVFLLVALVLVVNMLMIRRVSRAAAAFDPEHLDRRLPESGLPDEVLPLVRATNHLIAAATEVQTRQRFFLSAAAHELRTPLTVLRTRIEILDDGPMKNKLVGDVRRIIGLVNQLLTLMKLGTLRDVAGRVDLVASARKVVAELAPLAQARDVAIGFEPQLAACTIVGERELVEVAIANLVDNAISFTPDCGQVFVGLNVDGLLAVRDSGPGIDPATASTLFEPFVRFPSNRRGYGLGLAIVKAIADLHGGTVSVRNAEGKGAIFTLALPVEEPAADAPASGAGARIPPFRTMH